MQAVLATRASARSRRLSVQHLVIDELLVLKHSIRARPPWFRAKGGVGRIKTRLSTLYIRLRVVPGATMKTVVSRPWFERRYDHRRSRGLPLRPGPLAEMRLGGPLVEPPA